MVRLLVKWECLYVNCGKSFLVDTSNVDGKELFCPFCKSESEAVASQNPDVDIVDQLEGCLYPN